MNRSKLIFIADFGQEKMIPLLERFIEKYASDFDIYVSGYDYRIVRDRYKEYSNVFFGSMNSSLFFYYRDTAEYVVITAQATTYIKEKTNQKIIYLLSDFDTELFKGHIGEISKVVTSEKGTFDYFESNYPHIEAQYVAEPDGSDMEASLVDALGICGTAEPSARSYLVVDANKNHHFSYDEYGVGSYLKKYVTNDCDNIIALTIDREAYNCTSNILFSNTKRTQSVISEFDGTVLFFDEQSRCYFNSFIKEENIEFNAREEMLFSEMQLHMLENAVADKGGKLDFSNESNYSKYRTLMQKLYDLNNCADILVSIIICRYNTPLDLLNRSIYSALNTGHENVEVIVVDDGSKDIIEKELIEEFHDERIKYYHKENEGLGLSRNYGVRKAAGEYVFYLDSDDTIHEDGMKIMVSHAVFYDLDLVIGKRILCDENGVPYNESLKYLTGDLFTSYYPHYSATDTYVDVMVNNLLIRKKALFDLDIWFTKGLYEDVEYSPQLYRILPEYHYLNVIIHDWYQYGDNTTLSSTASVKNFLGRLEKEESAWRFVPEEYRGSRLMTIINSDFSLYYSAYGTFTDEEKETIWNGLYRFVQERKEYLQLRYYTVESRELVRSILADNRQYFDNVMNRYYVTTVPEEGYDDYIVMTHYHLFVACLFALKNKRKSRLFLCQSYTPFNLKLAYKVRETGLFESVKTFVYDSQYLDIFDEIKERPGQESVIIPDALYKSYSSVFKDCNKHLDTVYIFSDKNPYWYYVERDFTNIIKMEDAFNSFDREIETQKLTGIWGQIQQYEGNLYPLMNCKSDKIKKVIVSLQPDSVPDYLKDKIEVINTKDLESQYHDEIKQILFSIYDVDKSLFSADSTMILTQPLADCKYCTKAEQKKLFKKMCAPYEKSKILLKPHPADRMNYDYLGVNILPKNVPTEVYNYLDINIERVVTFASSAVETIEFAKEIIILFKLHDFSFDDVVDAIKDYNKDKEPGLKKIARNIKKGIKK